MHVSFRFYAELNDFLPANRRSVRFLHEPEGNPSVKDSIEALGIPHTEVDLILVNERSVDFGHRLQHGDRLSVYPVFESVDISSLVRVRPAPLREIRFVLDAHLGRLACYLRMLGFDTLYSNEFNDEGLAQISSEEKRILLTKDRGLLKRNLVTHGYCVRSSHPREEVVEILKRFDLFKLVKPFDRCLRCNALLGTVSKEEVLEDLPPRVRQEQEEFRRCRGCGQIYWKGSHFERMRSFLEHVLEQGQGNCDLRPGV